MPGFCSRKRQVLGVRFAPGTRLTLRPVPADSFRIVMFFAAELCSMRTPRRYSRSHLGRRKADDMRATSNRGARQNSPCEGDAPAFVFPWQRLAVII